MLSSSRPVAGPSRRKSAFTLIELLIVVAIIAILAAIAVPNFLEAQTRAKVSRTLADMRTMATALESYLVDFNTYPPAEGWPLSEEGQIRLTTPISYITSLPNDVFRPEGFLYFGQNPNPTNAFFSGPSGTSVQRDTVFLPQALGFQTLRFNTCIACFQSDYLRFLGLVQPAQLAPQSQWRLGAQAFQLRSLGPNRQDSQNLRYDPTNGTVSNGDIMRWGPSNETLTR